MGDYSDQEWQQETARVFPGGGRDLESAIQDAWDKIGDRPDLKRRGVRLTVTRIHGGNPIRWYSVVLTAD